MSIYGVQTFLSDVLTKQPILSAFESDAQRTLANYNLTENQQRMLAGLPTARLTKYFWMLVSKRLWLGMKAFPLTKSLLPDDFAARFSARYSELNPPAPVAGSPMFSEAMTLYRFLVACIQAGELSSPPYLLDVLTYEMLLFKLSNSPGVPKRAAVANGSHPSDYTDARPVLHPQVEIARFSYDIIPLVRALQARQESAPQVLACTLVFLRVEEEREVTVSKINEATRELISLCDGNRTMRQIAQELSERVSEGSSLQSKIPGILARLTTAGIICSAT